MDQSDGINRPDANEIRETKRKFAWNRQIIVHSQLKLIYNVKSEIFVVYFTLNVLVFGLGITLVFVVTENKRTARLLNIVLSRGKAKASNNVTSPLCLRVIHRNAIIFCELLARLSSRAINSRLMIVSLPTVLIDANISLWFIHLI